MEHYDEQCVVSLFTGANKAHTRFSDEQMAQIMQKPLAVIHETKSRAATTLRTLDFWTLADEIKGTTALLQRKIRPLTTMQ
ncbi:MAG: hypothetical protein QF815_01630 [Candidatus Peribacteraceae bacterium]|jgi:hypothetical protein|nr:hypothetical protein [Candidatus Peribacteraceae bacterium]